MFALYRLFAGDAEREALAARYRQGGMGYGEAKKKLFEKADAQSNSLLLEKITCGQEN